MVTKKKATPKIKRPQIPIRIQLNLWMRAAGRCQFQGCNKVLWKDDLTLTQGNYAEIAHIVSFSEKHFRGDKINSKLLATAYHNLMLLCPQHHKLIDTPPEGKRFTIEILTKYKNEHEDRIAKLVSIQEEVKTKVVLLQEKLNGISMNLNRKSIKNDLLPYYGDGADFEIDLTNLNDGGATYFRTVQDTLKENISTLLREKNSHVSLFALGKIPTLIQLGAFIGSRTQVNIFNFDRTKKKWHWPNSKPVPVNVVHRFNNVKEKRVAVILSLSAKIDKRKLQVEVHDYKNYIEISIDNPGIDTISSLSSFETVSVKIREALDLARNEIGANYRLDIFCAASCPVVIQFGMSLNPKLEKTYIFDLNMNAQYVEIGKVK